MTISLWLAVAIPIAASVICVTIALILRRKSKKQETVSPQLHYFNPRTSQEIKGSVTPHYLHSADMVRHPDSTERLYRGIPACQSAVNNRAMTQNGELISQGSSFSDGMLLGALLASDNTPEPSFFQFGGGDSAGGGASSSWDSGSSSCDTSSSYDSGSSDSGCDSGSSE